MQAITKWSTLVILALGVAGCGSTPATTSAPSHSSQASASVSSAATPFLSTNLSTKTVTLTLIAGYNQSNQGFNFDGGYKGNKTITIPIGYRVVVHLEDHAQLPHSAAVIGPTGTSATGPIIPGAATPNPLTGTPPGQSASFSFQATKTGSYRIGCLFPGHLILGMYLDLQIVKHGSPSLS